jgi:hypothetical protein
MTLDASGNLGLGVTPSAWGSTYKAFETTNGSVAGVSGALVVANNLYYNGSNWIYKATAGATLYSQSGSGNFWYNAPSGTAGNTVTLTQAMTLDASGNLLLGTTTGNGLRLDFSPGNQQQNGITYVQSSPNTFTDIYGAGTAGGWYGAIRFFTSFSATAAERARIDSSGNLLVGGTAARGTTVGTAHLDLFNGTAPAGTLTNGVSLYSSSGDLKFMDAAGNAYDVGFRNIPQNSQSAAYTLVLSDAGKHILHPASDANARTYTIPANSSVAYPIGTAITFVNMAAQVVTIAITTDTMYLSPAGTTGSRSLARYGSATALKISSTEWIIS